MKYLGSCHCGQIAFAVEGEITGLTACNCSICQRKGSLLWFVPRTQLTLATDPKAMSTYLFNKQVIQHHFCPTCGIHPFGEGTAPNGDSIAAVNVRCLEGVDLEQFSIHHYNGRSI